MAEPALATWTQIAHYLDVSVRTAQSWEEKYGLPVHRIGKRGRVFAHPHELDTWRDQHEAATVAPLTPPAVPDAPTPSPIIVPAAAAPSHRRIWRFAVLGVLVFTLLLATFLLFQNSPTPANWNVSNNTLIVSDKAGKELWHTTFADELEHQAYEGNPNNSDGPTLALIRDLDGDGTIETLFVLRYANRDARSNVLICFSQDGSERWRFVPGKPVRTMAESFAAIDNIPTFRVARLGKRPQLSIIVTAYHYLHYPVQISILDTRGTLVQEYWHAGHLATRPIALEVADLDRDGMNELYLGGVDQARAQATLVVLDPQDMTGAAPADNPAYQFQDLGTAQERARLYFPRSAMNQQFSHYNVVSHLHLSTDGITVDTLESFTEAGGPTILYELQPNLTLRRLSFGDIFTSTHERLRATHHLPTLDQERERLSTTITRHSTASVLR